MAAKAEEGGRSWVIALQAVGLGPAGRRARRRTAGVGTP